MKEITPFVYGAWPLVVAVLFRRLGPARATPIAVFTAFLLLPRSSPCEPFFEMLSINKRTISGLSLLLGVLVADPRALLRGRPRLVDLPMIAYLLMPLASFAANRFVNWPVPVAQLWANAFEWGLPYLFGRLYFGDREGPRRLSIAVVVAGLCYVPVCVYEMAVGPKYYLLGLLYGEAPHSHMVERLGGWRPEGFLSNGIELTTWMAMASTVAFWLWLRRGWTPPIGPPWAPALALIAVTIACRGAYGYLSLALGLVAAGLSHVLRTRYLLLALSFVPLIYLGIRMTGQWDGQALVELAGKAGSGGSIAYRIYAEDSYIKKTSEHNLVLGYGGDIAKSGIFDWKYKSFLWPDGWWIHQMNAAGAVGVAAFMLACFLFPAWLALALPPGRGWRSSPGALAWGLALFLILHLFDSLHNMALMPPSLLIGGSLVGVFLGRDSVRPEVPYIPRLADLRDSEDRIGLLVTLILLVCIEILGRLPRTPPPPSVAPAVEAASAKKEP